MITKVRRSPNTTIKDIARESGVSYSTVSRVINNFEHIKPETRERVMDAMTRLGYVANQHARSLVGGRSQVIGLLIHAFDSSYIGQIIQGIDEAVAEAHYDLMLYTTHRRKIRESSFVVSLARGLADGLLLVLPRDIEAYLDTLGQQGFPFVLIDYAATSSDVPSVNAANQQGAYDATLYLAKIGHRRIGFITGDMVADSAQERLMGYKQALAGSGIAFEAELVFQGDFYQSKGFEGANSLLSLDNPPTAIFASNDMIAFGVYEAVRNRGLRTPEDVSVVGFDDIPQAAQVHPSLTTVRQPLQEMGRIATQMLLRWIEEDLDEPLGYTQLATELIVRDSACSPVDSVFYRSRSAMPSSDERR
ncbi:MAG: LacI family DNA-binding transcriptional regulator [Anaerolineae bacterium]|nr:LacI family DNA-binding transcriptional regulator [Anaerolineae bacterium]